jgi:hypothetical protein
MPASGHQDHTASPSASSAFVKAPSASTASRLTSVTIAKRPLRKGGTDGGCKVIWVKPKQISFCKQDWTGRISLNCFKKFYFARTRLSVSAGQGSHALPDHRWRIPTVRAADPVRLPSPSRRVRRRAGGTLLSWKHAFIQSACFSNKSGSVAFRIGPRELDHFAHLISRL